MTSAGLDVCIGSEAGASLSVKSKVEVAKVEKEGNRVHALIESGWLRVVVRTTGVGGKKRAWVIVPGDQEGEIRHGELFVRGRFTIAMSSNNPKAADELWKSTQPE